MFENIREDYGIHEGALRNGAFWTMVVYRFGVWSLHRRFPPWRWATSAVYHVLYAITRSFTGVRVDRTTKIGERFHLIHPGMITIHPDTVIGDRVGIMHNVTLGEYHGAGSPTLGADVFVGCGSRVLGRITIGNDARIAANSLVITNVPAGAVAMGVPASILPGMSSLRKKKPAAEAEGT